MDANFRCEVEIANDTKLKAFGKGKTTVEFTRGKAREQLTLHGVLWVPENEANVISVAKLEDSGFTVHFKNK